MVGLLLTTPLMRQQVSKLIVYVYFDSLMHPSNIDMSCHGFYGWSLLNFIVCGGILSTPGNFTSPDYGVRNYSSNLNCEWLIQNPQNVNSSIVVILDDLHLEHHQTCEWDYLEFRLGE